MCIRDRFWPTENEFRALLNFTGHFRRMLGHQLECLLDRAQEEPLPPPPSDGLSDDPSGDVDKFVRRWGGRDPDRCRIYLHGARFGEGEIVVNSMLAEMMIEKAARDHSETPIKVRRREYTR